MHRRSYLLWPPVRALSSGSTLRIGGIRHYCCRGILLLFIINIVPGIYLLFFYVRTPGSLKIQDPVRVESNILLNTAASAAVRGRRVLSLLRISLNQQISHNLRLPPSRHLTTLVYRLDLMRRSVLHKKKTRVFISATPRIFDASKTRGGAT